MNVTLRRSQHSVMIGGWNRHSDPVESERRCYVATAVPPNFCKINKTLTNFGALVRTSPGSHASNSSDISNSEAVAGLAAADSCEVNQREKLPRKKSQETAQKLQQKDDQIQELKKLLAEKSEEAARQLQQIHKLEKLLEEKSKENDELQRQLSAPSVPPRAKPKLKPKNQRDSVSLQHKSVIRKHYTNLVKFVAVDYVAGAMYESEGLDLVSFERVQQLARVNRFDAVEKLLNIILKGNDDVYQKFLDALKNCEQEDLCNMLLEDEALDKTHVEAMQQQYDDLVKKIDSSPELLSYLFSLGFLTSREKDSVGEISVPCDRNGTLLFFARKKSSSKFDLFLEALKSTNQHTIAKKLTDNWSRLRKTETSSASRPPPPPSRTYLAKRR